MMSRLYLLEIVATPKLSVPPHDFERSGVLVVLTVALPVVWCVCTPDIPDIPE